MVGGNGSKKAAFASSASTNAYVSQEFGTPQTGVFAVQWDIYVDTILDISDPDRTGWMLIGDDTDPGRPGPNSNPSERFVQMAFHRDGGGTSGTMDLVARERGAGFTEFTTVASGLNLDQWYTIRVDCDVPAGTYDIYVDGVFQATVTSYNAKTSVTHISFAQWNDGAGAFYVDDVYEVTETTYTLTMAVSPTGSGTTTPSVGAHAYAEDEVVTISASPNTGYEFDHWTGDVANPNAASTTVVMDEDQTVTSHFVPTGAPTCVTIQRGTLGDVADGYIWEARPTGGNFTSSDFRSGFWSSGETRALIRFDLGVLPEDAVVQSAVLGLEQRSPGTGETVYIHRITEEWTEGGPTWDNFAGNYDAFAWASFGSVGGLITVDVTGLASAWVGGTESNYGMMLINSPTSAVDRYISSDYSRLDMRPWLEVCYVIGVNTPPVANDDTATTDEDTPVVIDVTANDTDVDGTIDPTTVSIVSGPANGSASVDPVSGDVTYTPDADYNGSDGFTYTVDDDDGATSNVATVTVTVNDVNDPPVANDDTAATTNEDTPVVIDVTANDTDVDGTIDPTTVSIVSGPANGSASVDPVSGDVTYTPDAGYSGSDSFTYTVDDDDGATSNVATVTVNVVPTVFLADNDFDASVDSADLRANGPDQDWYESRGDDPSLLFLDETTVGGNSTKKAGFTASTSGNAYVSQEFGTPQTGAFAVQWDIYVDEILDISAPDRAGWMLIGDDTYSGNGPNANNSERFVYMAFFRDGGGTAGTMDLVVRDRDDGWTSFTTIASGLNLDQWYTIRVDCDLDADTYDIYVDGVFQATVSSRNAKTSVTHISFAQWNDGAGAFYVDNVYEVTETTYELTMAVDPTAGGTTDPIVGVHTYPESEVVAITAYASAGYEFDHWTGDVADPNSASTTVTMAGDKTVTAHFSLLPTTYVLTMAVDPTAGGTTNPAVGAHTYPEDEVVAVTAIPNAGYEFDYWEGDVADPNSAYTPVTMDGDKTVTAHFSLLPTTYELTMAVDPTAGGTTDPVVGAHTYPEDEIVAVTAYPNAGYEFDHWTGDVADPNAASTTVTMDGDKTVTATFVPAGEPVCVTIQRGTFGEVDDGYIWEAYPTMDKFADIRLRTGLYTHPRYGSGETRSLLRFGLDFLPGGAVIQSATLGLMQRSPGSGETVNVYRITAAWSESDPPTWDFASNYDGTVEGRFVSTGDWVTADVTGLVSDWVGGTSNYGLMLINGQAADEYLSSDYIRNQPWLEVCYIP
jgi:uncharacterized repeat protein (TIGR02543 family)